MVSSSRPLYGVPQSSLWFCPRSCLGVGEGRGTPFLSLVLAQGYFGLGTGPAQRSGYPSAITGSVRWYPSLATGPVWGRR